MPVVTMKQLLEAGVHFGHQTRRWNPKMKRFIFGERNGIYIIDLQQSLVKIDEAYQFVRDLVGARRHDPVHRHQEAGAGARAPPRRPLRHALRQRALAGRHAHQLHDDPRPRVEDARARAPGALGRVRCHAQEGRPAQPARAAEAAALPPGHRRARERARRRLRGRHEEGAHRRHRGQQARDPGGGRGRHQLRPRPHQLRHPRQRRRDPRRRADVPDRGRRRRGGPADRRRRDVRPAAAALAAERRHRPPRSTPRSCARRRSSRPRPAPRRPRPSGPARSGCSPPARRPRPAATTSPRPAGGDEPRPRDAAAVAEAPAEAEAEAEAPATTASE